MWRERSTTRRHLFSSNDQELIVELLEGVHQLTNKSMGLPLSWGTEYIAFLNKDKISYTSPKLFGIWSEENDVQSWKQNFRKLCFVLKNILPRTEVHYMITSFFKDLEELNIAAESEFAYLNNHPSLWPKGTTKRFILEAKSWCDQNKKIGYAILDTQFVSMLLYWKEVVKNSPMLKSLLDESIKKSTEKRREKLMNTKVPRIWIS